MRLGDVYGSDGRPRGRSLTRRSLSNNQEYLAGLEDQIARLQKNVEVWGVLI